MKILGLSGRKQSGKNTAANFILGVNMVNYGIVRGSSRVTPDGQLWVSDIFGDPNGMGIVNTNYYASAETTQWWNDNVWPYVKIYSFADPLKQLCIQILGLSYEQCYGTNEQKNSLTHLRWEKMPDVLTPNKVSSMAEKSRTSLNVAHAIYPEVVDPGGPHNGVWKSIFDDDGFVTHEHGFMTAREVLQYVGTNIFRKMYKSSWVDATIQNEVCIEESELSIIDDTRFPDEIENIQKIGGKVIRFLRAPYSEDEHESEKVLDPENFDHNQFDAIIDNREMSINEQNNSVFKLLTKWNYLPAE